MMRRLVVTSATRARAIIFCTRRELWLGHSHHRTRVLLAPKPNDGDNENRASDAEGRRQTNKRVLKGNRPKSRVGWMCRRLRGC
jgi:hypothetical protein